MKTLRYISASRLSRCVILLSTSVALSGACPALTAQTASFAWAQIMLANSPNILVGNGVKVGNFNAAALDGAGDIFVTDSVYNAVTEFPKTANGFGLQTTLPTVGLSSPSGVAVDSAGDVFVTDPTNGRVVELVRASTGYGEQVTLSTSGIHPYGVALDASENLFLTTWNGSVGGVVELPRTATSYGPQTILPTTGLSQALGIVVDSSGNVFIGDTGNGRVVELPRTAGGYAPQTTVPVTVVSPAGLAMDGAGNLFIGDLGKYTVVELPRTAGGYGTEVSLGEATTPLGVAADQMGNLFVADSDRLTEVQTQSVNFESVNLCESGVNVSFPCDEDVTIDYRTNLYNATAVLGASSDADFSIYGQRCNGTECQAYFYFKPLAPGPRTGSVQLTSFTGDVLVTTPFVGFGQDLSTTIDFSQGFGGSAGTVGLNGAASLDGTALELTNGGRNAASSGFYTSPVNVQAFATDFTVQLTGAVADGFTFTIQNAGPSALGGAGGSLGYGGISHSLAIKFDLFQNSGDPSNNSTGLFIDGAVPIGPTSINLNGSGINLHSGDNIHAYITYDGTTLNLTLTDQTTFAFWSHAFVIDIPATVGGDTAYVGFTAGTGADSSTVQILNWSYMAAQPLYYADGFLSGSNVTNVGSAAFSGTTLKLTDGGRDEASSAFYTTPVNINAFTTDFTFKLTDPAADGFTVAILNSHNGLNSSYAGYYADSHGGGLGYTLMFGSVAIKFDLFQNDGDPSNNCTGLFVNGAAPIGPTSIDLNGTGIDLHSGDKMHAALTYNGTTLTLTLTDEVTKATWSHSFTIDIASTIGTDTAYVGFTAGTGALTATQQIFSWTFAQL